MQELFLVALDGPPQRLEDVLGGGGEPLVDHRPQHLDAGHDDAPRPRGGRDEERKGGKEGRHLGG